MSRIVLLLSLSIALLNAGRHAAFAQCDAASIAIASPSPTPQQLDSAAAKEPVKKLILPGESFLVEGRPAFIMFPPAAKRTTPQPWIMYAPTLPGLPDQHEKWMHQQFLAAGIAVAGIDVGEAYGSPQSQQLYDALYRELTQRRGFARKCCLLGAAVAGCGTVAGQFTIATRFLAWPAYIPCSI